MVITTVVPTHEIDISNIPVKYNFVKYLIPINAILMKYTSGSVNDDDVVFTLVFFNDIQ